MTDFIRALRPSHWIKNTIVLAAFFFALGDAEQAPMLAPRWSSFVLALSAAVVFCVVSGGVYVLNDIVDIGLDRLHPVKRLRPIAAGRITLFQARLFAALLIMTGLAVSYFLSARLAGVAAGYVLIQAAYSLGLKRVALVDVLVIAAGFVLRALAGAVVLNVSISPWLMLCTFLLALFLGFCKRRHEKILLENYADENRPSLEKYDEKLLDQVIAIVASATIVSYALYTLSPETVRKFGSSELGFTIPFVIFGIFRYLDLVYRHEKGHRPERILLTDIPILVNVVLYGLTVLYIFFRS